MKVLIVFTEGYKMLKLSAKIMGLAFLIWALSPGVSYAYLDPGSGSLIVQMIIAGAAGIAFGVKVFWYRIREFFSSLSRGSGNE